MCNPLVNDCQFGMSPVNNSDSDKHGEFEFCRNQWPLFFLDGPSFFLDRGQRAPMKKILE